MFEIAKYILLFNILWRAYFHSTNPSYVTMIPTMLRVYKNRRCWQCCYKNIQLFTFSKEYLSATYNYINRVCNRGMFQKQIRLRMYMIQFSSTIPYYKYLILKLITNRLHCLDVAVVASKNDFKDSLKN